MALAERIPSLKALNEDRRRHQRVKVNLLGRYMLADRREFPCQVINMSPGGMALIAPVGRRRRRAHHCLCRSSRPARRATLPAFQNGFAMTISATARKARQARRPAHLARQPPYSRPAGRPPPWPYGAAQPGRPPDPAERRQPHLPDHRRVGIRRRHRHRTSGRRSARWSLSARCRAAWCATSKMASPSSSLACSILTFSKRTFAAASARRLSAVQKFAATTVSP